MKSDGPYRLVQSGGASTVTLPLPMGAGMAIITPQENPVRVLDHRGRELALVDAGESAWLRERLRWWWPFGARRTRWRLVRKERTCAPFS